MRWIGFVLFAAVLCAQNEEGPPRLKRGIPKAGDPTRKGEARPEAVPIPLPPGREIVTDSEGRVVKEESTAAAPEPEDPIDKARVVAFDFAEQLPNFICQQLTLRYSGEGLRNIDWKLQDRIETDLMYSEGKESYGNFKRNGKLIKKGGPQDTGSWSTGEYGTIQLDVLASNTNAEFKFDRDSEVGGRPAKKYTYRVLKANSHWKVDFGGNVLYPAYHGSVWIDNETSRVLRVEMIGRQIPESYPMASVEMTVDYGMVKLGDKQFLLPTRAENLACGRASITCVRNEVKYMNYRRFTAESTISTTESTVTFDGEQPPPAAAPEKKKQKNPR
jgi:hypothetical protein